MLVWLYVQEVKLCLGARNQELRYYNQPTSTSLWDPVVQESVKRLSLTVSWPYLHQSTKNNWGYARSGACLGQPEPEIGQGLYRKKKRLVFSQILNVLIRFSVMFSYKVLKSWTEYL